MNEIALKSGVVHKIPGDLKDVLSSNTKIKDIWNDITPLARNEWLCWICSAKKIETRNRRIDIMKRKLYSGEKRPCCWAGCIHR